MNEAEYGANNPLLTDEEHRARAMLLGMIYHNGNGNDHFYYRMGSDGIPEVSSMVDADTLEPLGYSQPALKNQGPITGLYPNGREASIKLFNDFGADKLPRPKRRWER